jgi:hypothetical protein|uniref:Uncharacterized protein n=1 Tax=viral metagenome TaxID=1070528 RepID=A0A6C0CIC7_9ZZZZ
MNIFFTLLFSHMIACHSIGFATYILEKPFMMYIRTNDVYYIYILTFLLVSMYCHLFIN